MRDQLEHLALTRGQVLLLAEPVVVAPHPLGLARVDGLDRRQDLLTRRADRHHRVDPEPPGPQRQLRTQVPAQGHHALAVHEVVLELGVAAGHQVQHVVQHHVGIGARRRVVSQQLHALGMDLEQGAYAGGDDVLDR